MSSPFDYINAITHTKEDMIVDEQSERAYSPFVVNRGLSYFVDCTLQANEMNVHNTMPKRWQFAFLKNVITKKKRFSKWNKKQEDSSSIDMLMTYYKYNREKASQALALLTPEQLREISDRLYTGGRVSNGTR